MGISGIREMSTILTPPEERHPVLTSVGPYDEKQIAAAIRRELLRDGQVFFVHNRVSSINKVAARIAELVPEARVGVGHGQMNEHTLEKIMGGFVEREFDVLVATTIVESGLDIPNANTLIVDRADAYGLPALHQLRGRVGRSRERGYAYFLYPPEKPLTETAHERLSTLQQHSGVGAGMHIALKDLEIRGAGNLLGGEQSGHVAAVGFDLYVKMIGEAVRELRGDGPAGAGRGPDRAPGGRAHPARLRHRGTAPPGGLHPDRGDRLPADINAVRDELADRYGPVPDQVECLLTVARLRAQARRAGPHRHHPAGQQHPVLAGRAARFPAGPGAAAVPADAAEAGSAYHARTGAEGCPWNAPGIGQHAGGHRADCVTRRPAAARRRPARLVRGTDRVGAQCCGRRAEAQARRAPHRGGTSSCVAPRCSWPRRWLVGGLAVAAAASSLQLGAAATTSQEPDQHGHADQRGRQPEHGLRGQRQEEGEAPAAGVTQVPQQVLTWLLTFQIVDELAQQHGISPSPGRRAEPADGAGLDRRPRSRSTPTPTSRRPAACRRTCCRSSAGTSRS